MLHIGVGIFQLIFYLSQKSDDSWYTSLRRNNSQQSRPQTIKFDFKLGIIISAMLMKKNVVAEAATEGDL